MAKPRLKVYRAQMGFAETVVAAPSQKAALEAWGARQNLFAEGLADVAEDAGAVAAALAEPGVVLQRPAGGRGAFAAQLVGRPTPPPAKSKPKAKPAVAAKTVKREPKPDRSALTAAEKALAAIETQAKARLAELARRREQLDAEEGRLRRDLDARRAAAQVELDAARKRFEAG